MTTDPAPAADLQDDAEKLSDEVVDPEGVVVTVYACSIPCDLHQAANDEANVERPVGPSLLEEVPEVWKHDKSKGNYRNYAQREGRYVAIEGDRGLSVERRHVGVARPIDRQTVGAHFEWLEK